MNRRRHAALLAALAVAALALAWQLPGAATSATKPTRANYTVWAGPGFLKTPPVGVPMMTAADLFFPQRLQIHVGDSVTFKSKEFHTATYLGAHKPSEFPIFTQASEDTYSGVNDAAGAPFSFSGKQKFTYNAQALAPSGSSTIAGGSAVHNSGVLGPRGYTFTFTKPGDYVIRCLVHPDMTMHVVVEPRSAAVAAPSQVLKAMAGELSSAAATAKALDKVLPSDPNTVLAGVGKPVRGGSVELMSFKPQKLTVKVGTTVTFQFAGVMEPHNMVFGPADYVKQSLKTLDLTPRGPGSPNQAWPFYFYGSEPAVNGVYTYSGTNHGNGFLATPLLGPPMMQLPKTLRITFTAPGVYKYICGIHGPDMNGEIDVVS